MKTAGKLIWERVKDKCLQWVLYTLTGWTERLAKKAGIPLTEEDVVKKTKEEDESQEP